MVFAHVCEATPIVKSVNAATATTTTARFVGFCMFCKRNAEVCEARPRCRHYEAAAGRALQATQHQAECTSPHGAAEMFQGSRRRSVLLCLHYSSSAQQLDGQHKLDAIRQVDKAMTHRSVPDNTIHPAVSVMLAEGCTKLLPCLLAAPPQECQLACTACRCHHAQRPIPTAADDINAGKPDYHPH